MEKSIVRAVEFLSRQRRRIRLAIHRKARLTGILSYVSAVSV